MRMVANKHGRRRGCKLECSTHTGSKAAEVSHYRMLTYAYASAALSVATLPMPAIQGIPVRKTPGFGFAGFTEVYPAQPRSDRGELTGSKYLIQYITELMALPAGQVANIHPCCTENAVFVCMTQPLHGIARGPGQGLCVRSD